jgi:hypothetical protein
MVTLNDPRWLDLPFPGKHEGEHFQFFFRQHPIRLLRPLFQCIGSMLGLAALAYVLIVSAAPDESTRHLAIAIILVMFILTNVVFLGALYRYCMYIIVVTDRKIHRIKKTLLAVDDHQTIDLWVLQDIFKSQHGLVQNVFGFGTLIMEAQETQLRLHFIPGIQDKYLAIMKLREQARTTINQVQTARMQGIAPDSVIPPDPGGTLPA